MLRGSVDFDSRRRLEEAPGLQDELTGVEVTLTYSLLDPTSWSCQLIGAKVGEALWQESENLTVWRGEKGSIHQLDKQS